MTASDQKHSLTFEEFRALMAKELALDEDQLNPEARLYDLMVDSIRMVEMLLHFEEQGIEIPLELAWQIETVEDCYRLYAEGLSPGGWTVEARGVG